MHKKMNVGNPQPFFMVLDWFYKLTLSNTWLNGIASVGLLQHKRDFQINLFSNNGFAFTSICKTLSTYTVLTLSSIKKYIL